MSSWLEQLERELDARLSAFLRNNPVQDNLFSEQHLRDRAGALQRQRPVSYTHLTLPTKRIV